MEQHQSQAVNVRRSARISQLRATIPTPPSTKLAVTLCYTLLLFRVSEIVYIIYAVTPGNYVFALVLDPDIST